MKLNFCLLVVGIALLQFSSACNHGSDGEKWMKKFKHNKETGNEIVIEPDDTTDEDESTDEESGDKTSWWKQMVNQWHESSEDKNEDEDEDQDSEGEGKHKWGDKMSWMKKAWGKKGGWLSKMHDKKRHWMGGRDDDMGMGGMSLEADEMDMTLEGFHMEAGGKSDGEGSEETDSEMSKKGGSFGMKQSIDRIEVSVKGLKVGMGGMKGEGGGMFPHIMKKIMRKHFEKMSGSDSDDDEIRIEYKAGEPINESDTQEIEPEEQEIEDETPTP